MTIDHIAHDEIVFSNIVSISIIMETFVVAQIDIRN